MDNTKIRGLAASLGVRPYNKDGSLTLSTSNVNGDAGIPEAKILLAKTRRTSSIYRDPTEKFSRRFKSKKRLAKEQDDTLWCYTPEELASAFQAAIDDNRSIQVVAALIQLGAPIDLGKALTKATSLCRSDIVSLLLKYAEPGQPPPSTETCLRNALNQLTLKNTAQPDPNQLSLVSDLVAIGAKVPSDCFERAVKQQQNELVAILLRAKEPAPNACLSNSLSDAVRLNNYELLSMLLAYGANPDVKEAESLLASIETRNLDFAAAQLAYASGVTISQTNLTSCLRLVLSSLPPANDFQWLKLFLSSGAESYTLELARRLQQAVATGDISTVQLLVEYNTPIDSPSHNALGKSIELFNRNMMQILLQGGSMPTGMFLDICKSQNISALDMTKDRASIQDLGKALCVVIELGLPQRLSISETLLHQGCPEKSKNEALVLSVTKRRQKLGIADSTNSDDDDRSALIELLLDHGADPDSGNAAALKACIDNSMLEILKSLLKVALTKSSIDSVFNHARTVLDNDDSRYCVYGLILSVQSVRPTQLNEALFDSANRESKHHELWQLLLISGASVNYERGKAIKQVIKSRNFGSLSALLEQKVPQSILNDCVTLVMEDKQAASAVPLKMLLEAGASGTVLDNALNQAVTSETKTLVDILLHFHKSLGRPATLAVEYAARSGNVDLLKRLLNNVKDKFIVSAAFKAMTINQVVEKHPTGQYCAKLLLQKGPDDQAINEALSSYLKTYRSTANDETYIDLLLNHSADVNAFGGKIMETVARSGNKDLFLKLLAHGATTNPLTTAMPLLFSSRMPEEDLVEIVNSCFDRRNTPRIDESDMSDSLVYLSLANYPSGDMILQALLDHGYSPDFRRNVIVHPEIGEEQGNAAICALTMDEVENMTTKVFRMLVEAGTNLNFATRKSWTTVLMIAASNNKLDLIDILLQFTADLSLKDVWGRTALSYASENGHIDTVKRLCTTTDHTFNDGSLHEAARELHYSVVEHLIQAGHNPDYPCSLHEGRSALLELLLKAQVRNPRERSRLDKTLKILLKAGANPKIEYDGKNALYCTLHNKHPHEILSAYLDTDQWMLLDEQHNWFTDSQQICYSATMYILKGPWQGKVSERDRLCHLLRSKRCQDRYFAWEGDQPGGYPINPPEDIAKKERKKRAILEEHKFQMDLQRKEHLQQLEFQQKKHAINLRQDEERASTNLEAERERNRENARHEAQVAVQKQRAQDTERDAAVTHEKNLISMRQAENEHRVELDRRLLGDQERAANKQHERQMQIMNRSDESEKLRNRLRLSEMNEQKRLMSSPSPLLLMGSSGSDCPD